MTVLVPKIHLIVFGALSEDTVWHQRHDLGKSLAWDSCQKSLDKVLRMNLRAEEAMSQQGNKAANMVLWVILLVTQYMRPTCDQKRGEKVFGSKKLWI